MSMQDLEQRLAKLAQQQSLRQFTSIEHKGRWVRKEHDWMLNLSSNDYLGLASDESLRKDFWPSELAQSQALGSSSSRLLTGNFSIYTEFETLLSQRFASEAALLFNTGYHANIGILPALADEQSLILSDTLNHASLIDGCRLAKAQVIRYRHNDYEHLEQLLEKHQTDYKRIIIVTESIFSMDGDCADLNYLTELKQRYTNLVLYVDEAHAVGAYGATGLGLAEEQGCIGQIDILVGTFGKALASVGAYVICSTLLKEYLINTMRPLIFSTSLPPINVAWTYYLFKQLEQWGDKRAHLKRISHQLQKAIRDITGEENTSRCCIVPLVIGENERCVRFAQSLQQAGFYCLPIRPPTVPQGTSRIRFSLSAAMQTSEIEALIHHIAALYTDRAAHG